MRRPRVAFVQAPVFDPGLPSNGLALMNAHLKRIGVRPTIHDAAMGATRRLAAIDGFPLNGYDGDFGRFRDWFEEARRRHARSYARFLEEEAQAVLAARPDIAAFSVLAETEAGSLELARLIKARKPSCRVVFGGPQCLRDTLAEDLAARPEVDAVVLGEADVSFPALIEAFDPKAGALPRVPGLLIREEGRTVDTGDAPPIEDLDRLPFLDFSNFPMHLYNGNTVFISTSRGCVRKCAFCTHIVQQKVFRLMSARRTVEEMKHQLSRFPGRRWIEFADSLVNGDVRRFGEIADLLIEWKMERLLRRQSVDFGWSGMAILHPTMTPALLKKLSQAGCRRLCYGFESGSQKIVDAMGKNFRLADAEKVIRDTAKAGIWVYLFVLVGFPGETEDDFEMTLRFIERNRRFIWGMGVSYCEIQKGSELDHRAEEFGVRLPLADRTRWTSLDGTNTFEVRKTRWTRAHEAARRFGFVLNRQHTSKVGEFSAAV